MHGSFVDFPALLNFLKRENANGARAKSGGRTVPVGPEQRLLILQPDDVAAAALFVATLHPRASVPELVIKPTTHVYI